MAFTESNDPKTRVSVTFKANCSLGHNPKDYAEFIQKVWTFYYPQHHVHDVVVTQLDDLVTETPPPRKAPVAKPAPAPVLNFEEEEDFS